MKKKLMALAIIATLALGMPTFARGGGCHCGGGHMGGSHISSSHSSFGGGSHSFSRSSGSFHTSGASSAHISSFRSGRGFFGGSKTTTSSRPSTTHYTVSRGMVQPHTVYVYHYDNSNNFWQGYWFYSMMHHSHQQHQVTPQERYTKCVQHGGGTGCNKLKNGW